MIASRQGAASGVRSYAATASAVCKRVAGEIGQRLGDRRQAQVAGHVATRDIGQLPPVGDPEPRDGLGATQSGPAPTGSSDRIRHVSAYRVRQPARDPVRVVVSAQHDAPVVRIGHQMRT